MSMQPYVFDVKNKSLMNQKYELGPRRPPDMDDSSKRLVKAMSIGTV